MLTEHSRRAKYESKALALARSCIWPHADVKDNITVETLRGGSYNRIIGLTLTSSQSKDQDLTCNKPTEERTSETVTKYILRIPQFVAQRVDDDVAALLFVNRLPTLQHGTEVPEIPVPKIITFDETKNNRLRSCYMVQERLYGQPLVDVYRHQLGHGKQRRVAHDLGRVYRRMLAVTSTQAGRLILPDDNKSLEAEIHVIPWVPCPSIFCETERKPRKSAPYRAGDAGESVLELLRRTHHEQKAEIRERLPKDKSRPKIIDEWFKVASEMDAAGYFKESDGHFALAHLDLHSRNILVDKDSPWDRPIITGILDWDTAVLAPAFMSCDPPTWIWNWGRKGLADEEPATPEKKELKRDFEAAAGPRYIKFAYHPAYRMARRLVKFAIRGRWSMKDEQEVADLLAEWRGLLEHDTVMEMIASGKK